MIGIARKVGHILTKEISLIRREDNKPFNLVLYTMHLNFRALHDICNK
jgi:hypothetical protein